QVSVDCAPAHRAANAQYVWLPLSALLVALVVLMITRPMPGSGSLPVRVRASQLLRGRTERLMFELQISAHGCSIQRIGSLRPLSQCRGSGAAPSTGQVS